MNKPLKQLDKEFIKKKLKLVVFDLDGVVVPTGTVLKQNIEGTETYIKTHKLSDEMIKILKELKKHISIAFSSGRSLLHLETMVEEILWNNVSLIGENGNFIFIDGKITQLSSYNKKYFQKLVDIKKDLKKIKIKKPDEVYGFEPKHMIITFHTENKLPEIKEIVKKHDKEEDLYCLWTNEGYDIGHKKTNKKTALNFLTDKLDIEESEVITTGNNLNDKEMLEFGIGVSTNPERVGGQYAIPQKEGRLGGKVLAQYILKALKE